MQSKDNLTKRFSTANLPLELLGAPFANRDVDIFQMDISRRGRAEIFRLFPGHEDNEVLVQGVEKQIRQLVLYVREPKRAFEVEHRIRGSESRKRALEAIEERRGHVLRTTDKIVVEEQFTTDSKRHYLCGHDESHLFIAQLPAGVSTVQRAHEVLRAPEARDKDARRQGEWFFIDLNSNERKIVEHAASQGMLRNAGIGSSYRRSNFGRLRNNVRKMLALHEHVAEEVVAIPLGEGSSRSLTIYVRGKIRHVDHKTIVLREWKRVALNTEAAQQTATRAMGINWID